MNYAVLCGSSPVGYRQNKLNDLHDSLENSGEYEPGSIIVFPCGVHELFLECVLNEAFDKICESASEDDDVIGGIFLYLCALAESDLHAELSDSYTTGVEAVRLGNDEIQKGVITHYQDLAEKCGIEFRVEYDFDGEFLSDESLGWEKVSAIKTVEDSVKK